MGELSIASIVATGKVNREFELEAVSSDLNPYSLTYSKDGHAGMHMKFYQNGPTVTLFRTGSCNIRGASSIEEAYKNKSLVEDSLSNLNMDVEISSFHITNIVFTADMKNHMNLNELAVKLGLENTEYEPEQFPGMVYRVNEGVFLIFSSGKVVLTGFTKIEDAKKAYHELVSELDNG